MSASSKKKLRKENAAAQLTEKQRKEQAEAKKLKQMTVSFIAIMLVIALTAGTVLIVRGVNQSGVFQKNTIAAIIEGEELNSVQMNYYLNDYIKNQYATWEGMYSSSTSLYLGLMGLDVNKPLDEQTYDPDTGATWGDFFLGEALKKATSDYALYAKATSEGFKLSEDVQASLDSNSQMLELYAMIYGYSNVNKYLQALYGYGSDLDSYNKYVEISSIASAYATQYNQGLTYDMEAIREYEADRKLDYTSFSYALYALSQSSFLEGGTKDENGNTTYSDAEKEAALKKAENIANTLALSVDIAELDQAIAGLEINKDNESAASSVYTDVFYTNISAILRDWLADEKRVENEMAVIPNEVTSTDADGKETKTVNGYYVICFQNRNENLRPLANVRHLLVKFEGGTTASDGSITYSDTEKATAKAEAEKLLKEWEDGAKTEESFIELVKKYTDDEASKETGGLYEDIYPGANYVENFLNWSIDPDRKVGDTAIIVSDYGYHIMFYSSDDELTYRDYMIREDMREADTEEWYNSIVDAFKSELKDSKYLATDMVLAHLSSY